MSKAAVVLGVAGVAAVGVGLVVANQKAEAEKKVADALAPTAPPGTVTAPNIPTHTTQPSAEQQQATLLQLLNSYRSDLARLQSERLTVEYELQQIESAGNAGCEGYALEPDFTYRCNGFPVCGWNEWWEISGSKTNQTLLNQCKTAVTGVGSLADRTIEMRGEHNRPRWQNLMDIIRQGKAQAEDAATRYQATKLRLQEIDRQIAEVQKKIADLNARGVY
jgi:hypothetical protein